VAHDITQGMPVSDRRIMAHPRVSPCFTPGVMIATPRGELPVEELKVGDKVITRDNGLQEIVWLGRQKFSWKDVCAEPHLKPVVIRQGALGNGLPERDMMVSPDHRILVTGDNTAVRFNEAEVLVSARHLLSGRKVFEVNSMGTIYIHFMFARHQVVLSDGAWTESFQPSDFVLKGMGNAQRNEIFEIFPNLRSEDGRLGYLPARKVVQRQDAGTLAK
jgi:hypothetical protein